MYVLCSTFDSSGNKNFPGKILAKPVPKSARHEVKQLGELTASVRFPRGFPANALNFGTLLLSLSISSFRRCFQSFGIISQHRLELQLEICKFMWSIRNSGHNDFECPIPAQQY